MVGEEKNFWKCACNAQKIMGLALGWDHARPDAFLQEE
jgi:hypothetical protein